MKPTPILPKLRHTSSVSNGRTVAQPGHLLLEVFTVRGLNRSIVQPLSEDLEIATTSCGPVNFICN
jgi:hypothetical protein